MKVHDANTNFWLKRMMIKSVFDYDACVDATYRLLQRTLSDYNKVKVMYTLLLGGASVLSGVALESVVSP